VSQNQEWSPDQAMGTETFEQGDEAADESARIDPAFAEEAQQDPSLDPSLQVDNRELEEAGAVFDDPEEMVSLDGGIDDPDGLEQPGSHRTGFQDDGEGWDLDAPMTAKEQVAAELLDATSPD
jgi:hypothetical protein